jgi:hypothetical protein
LDDGKEFWSKTPEFRPGRSSKECFARKACSPFRDLILFSGEEENVFVGIKTCLKPLDLSQSDEAILASIATETLLRTG